MFACVNMCQCIPRSQLQNNEALLQPCYGPRVDDSRFMLNSDYLIFLEQVEKINPDTQKQVRRI